MTNKQMDVAKWKFMFGVCGVGQGREDPQERSLDLKAAAWTQRPLSAALGTDPRKVFEHWWPDRPHLMFVTLLIEIDSPFLLFIKTKQKPQREKPTRHGFACHATVCVTVAVFQKKHCFLCFPSF